MILEFLDYYLVCHGCLYVCHFIPLSRVYRIKKPVLAIVYLHVAHTYWVTCTRYFHCNLVHHWRWQWWSQVIVESTYNEPIRRYNTGLEGTTIVSDNRIKVSNVSIRFLGLGELSFFLFCTIFHQLKYSPPLKKKLSDISIISRIQNNFRYTIWFLLTL